jgi:AraC family transcriptional regulator
MLAMRLYSEFMHLDGVSPLAIEGLFLELIATVSRRMTGNFRCKSDRWLRQACDLLRARFSESLSLNEIAHQVGVHPVHLARGFRRSFGTTVGEYVRQLRVDHARTALSEGNARLRDVALDAGFFDQSHFCRVFRRFTGMTPQEYRSLMSPAVRTASGIQ